MTTPSLRVTGRSAVAAGTAFPLRLRPGASDAGDEGAVPPADPAAGVLHDLDRSNIAALAARSVNAGKPHRSFQGSISIMKAPQDPGAGRLIFSTDLQQHEKQ